MACALPSPPRPSKKNRRPSPPAYTETDVRRSSESSNNSSESRPLTNANRGRLPTPPAYSYEDRLLTTTENPFVNTEDNASSGDSQRTRSRNFSSFTSLNIFKENTDLFLMDKQRHCNGVLLQGPRRLLRLCVFGTVIPVLLICIPLYVRLMLYPPFHYSMAPTDQRLLQQQSSSVWCQAQNVQMNGSFTAYLLHETPPVKSELSTHTMLRHLTLSDDVKEYWGFFLQKGSIVEINLCTRYDGGMLMIMRGLHNLRKCAWIGEDSKEHGEDLNEESNESGEPPEFHLEVPIVRKNSSLLMEKSGVLVKANDTIAKDNAEKTSEERRAELDYYVQKAIQLSKHKKELMERLNEQKTNNWMDGIIEEIDKQKARKKNKTRKTKGEGKKKRKNNKGLKKKNKKNASNTDRLRRSLNEEIDNGAVEELDENDKILMEELNNEDLKQNEINHERQNSSSEVSDKIKELYFNLFHLPNGLSYQRGKVNSTTDHDMSNEEQRSSFSSSEEALTRCSGLLGVMPLYQNAGCNGFGDTKTNKIKYKIPVTGTYYFVFSSDNEVFDSQIFFNMTLQRVVYDTSRATDTCVNKSQCSLPFSFWSNDQTLVQLPESNWDFAYTLNVTCQPRVAIYLTILILVPIAILFCTLY